LRNDVHDDYIVIVDFIHVEKLYPPNAD